jgi:hypothetical protein
MALGGQLVEHDGQLGGVVEDHAVGEQLVELDDLFDVVGVVVADDPGVAEGQPLGEVWNDSTRVVIVVMVSRPP